MSLVNKVIGAVDEIVSEYIDTKIEEHLGKSSEFVENKGRGTPANVTIYGYEPSIFNALFNTINRSQSNYNLHYTCLNDFQTVIGPKIAAGESPDIAICKFSEAKYIIDNYAASKCIPLDDASINSTFNIISRFQPNLALKSGSGKVFSYPIAINTLCNTCFYNKNAFSDHKLSVPKTYSDWLQLCNDTNHLNPPISLGACSVDVASWPLDVASWPLIHLYFNLIASNCSSVSDYNACFNNKTFNTVKEQKVLDDLKKVLSTDKTVTKDDVTKIVNKFVVNSSVKNNYTGMCPIGSFMINMVDDTSNLTNIDTFLIPNVTNANPICPCDGYYIILFNKNESTIAAAKRLMQLTQADCNSLNAFSPYQNKYIYVNLDNKLTPIHQKLAKLFYGSIAVNTYNDTLSTDAFSTTATNLVNFIDGNQTDVQTVDNINASMK
jgi:ABC-type glycerol-3-phosphate transport system substrate-binding protein